MEEDEQGPPPETTHQAATEELTPYLGEWTSAARGNAVLTPFLNCDGDDEVKIEKGVLWRSWLSVRCKTTNKFLGWFQPGNYEDAASVVLEGGILSLDIHNEQTGELIDSARLVKICVAGQSCDAVVPPPEPNLVRGKQEMNTCLACHQWNQNDTGPKLEKLFGKRAAKVAGFAYSDDMKNTKVRWDNESIDAFLANPQKVIPHNQMVLVPMTDRSKRRDLMAYLFANGFR